MPRTTSANTLISLIRQLRSDRQRHADALARIDATFSELGISSNGSSRRGRKQGRPAATTATPSPRRRRRRHFKLNAAQFLLDLLKGKTLTTAQINEAWKKAGRGGVANNTLGTLAKAQKVMRAAVKGGRGSRYSIK